MEDMRGRAALWLQYGGQIGGAGRPGQRLLQSSRPDLAVMMAEVKGAGGDSPGVDGWDGSIQ